MTTDKKIEITKNIFEIAAILLAAIFFIYKILGGWLLVNVAIGIELERMHIPNHPNLDYLAITLNIDKKDSGSVVLEDVRVRITDPENGEEIAISSFFGIEKLEYTPISNKWALNRELKNQRLTPGTSTELSAFFKVPRSKPVLVDVSLISIRDFSASKNQIRATKVSLPVAKLN